MCSILLDGTLVKDVQPVRQAVFSNFVAHFQAHHLERPAVDELHFRGLAFADGGGLIKPFSVEEVKAAIWDSDSFKSPGPDGINFSFMKDFWIDLKEDIMRFVT